MRKDIREVSKLFCEPESRHKGDATALMTAICKEADSKRMILMLTVEAFGDEPLSSAKLAEWYGATFDFNTIQESPHLMARMFNPFPESGLTEKIGQIITEGI